MNAIDPTGASLRNSTFPSTYFTRLVLFGSTVPVEPTQTCACAAGTLNARITIAANPMQNLLNPLDIFMHLIPVVFSDHKGERGMEQIDFSICMSNADLY
jgi:hypothetical protein